MLSPEDKSGNRKSFSPLLPGAAKDIQGPGGAVIVGLDIGLQAAPPIIIGMAEDEPVIRGFLAMTFST